MTTVKRNRAIGIFSTYHQVETALNALRSLSFPMQDVSVMVREPDRNNSGRIALDHSYSGNKLEETAVAGSLTGGALGSLAGLLIGLGGIFIPGFGVIAVGGAVATALAATLSGGVIGASAGGLLGGLIGLGIPEDRARFYSDRLSKGEYLVLLEGTPEQVDRARTVLNQDNTQWDLYE
jgi:hypothetical protein